MIDDNSLSGSFEFTLSDNKQFKLINIVDNKSVNEDRFIFDINGSLSRSVSSSGNSKIMMAEGSGG